MLNQEAVVYETETDKYGDQKSVSSQTLPCRFRYITNVDRNVQAESMGSEAMIWFEPTAEVAEATIVQIDNGYWRIDKLVKARRASNDVLFLKAFVTKHQLSN